MSREEFIELILVVSGAFILIAISLWFEEKKANI